MSSSPESASRKALLREALRTVEDLQARLDESEKARREPIAVVGLGCRYPGGGDPDALWRLLREGGDAVAEVPADRWDPDALDVGEAGERGRVAARLGGFLEHVDLFDAAFFGISPREAATLDPQQRLLLEVAWEALENAGQAPDRLKGSRTGVFVGITTRDYAKNVGIGEGGQTDVYGATGNALNAAAGRISFVLGLQGPCMAVDTACSSSLTATHLACQSLRAGDCDLALAGGVNVVLSPDAALLFARWGMLAADGRCKTFDAAADGFVRSEGCGVVVLKRLSRAEADGDSILALLLGSAVNQDGASSGLTVPNGPAQQAVLRRALEVAGVEPRDVDYIEAHGTGTPIGDPIEVEALAAVMGRGRAQGHPLAIGSIKTNIGHAEAASGVAGLLKVVLSLQHDAIPPHLHVQELNPRLAWGDEITVPTVRTPWPRGERRRIAGVSSFGFSGTNAHVVVAEPPSPPSEAREAPDPSVHALMLSARTEEALREAARRLDERLGAEPPLDLGDVAFTLNTGRAALAERAAVVARDLGEARERLGALAGGREAPGLRRGHVRAGERPRLAFLFTGQGSQSPGMGRGLHADQPVFRRALDRCDELLRPSMDRPLLDVLFREEHASLLDETGYTQPALFAIEWSLAELWRSWGVEPAAVLGHSIGELVAACVAGVMSLEDGLRLAADRGRLMQALPRGDMAVVFAPEEQVVDAIAPWRASVSIAAVNGPESVVVSGESAAVRELQARLESQGTRTEALRVSHAFHSPMMDPMLDALEQRAREISFADPRIDLISNLTAVVVAPGEIDAGYWRRHARQPVRFEASMRTLREHGWNMFVEVGPHPTLLGLAQRCLDGGVFLPSLRRGQPETATLLGALSGLFVHGAEVDWAAVDRGRGRRRVALPTYPFQRSRFWVEAPRSGRRGPRASGRHPFLGTHVQVASAAEMHVWEGEIGIPSFPYLKDHRVESGAIVPATAWTEMALEAFAEAHGPGPVVLEEIDYLKPLFLADEALHEVQVVLSGGAESGRFEISSQPLRSEASDDARWTRHSTGRIRRGETPAIETTLPSLEEMQKACPREVVGTEFYRFLRERGNDWGPSFQGLQRVWCGRGEAWSEVEAPEGAGMGLDRYVFHPALADAAGHVLTATVPLERSEGSRGGAFVGGGIEEVRLYRRPASPRVWAHARLRPAAEVRSNVLVGDVRVFDETGGLVSELTGARLWYLDADARPMARSDVAEWLYEVAWSEVAREKRPRPAAATGGEWLLIGGHTEVGRGLAEVLQARGEQCTAVPSDADPSGLVSGKASGPRRGAVLLRPAAPPQPGAPATGSAAEATGVAAAVRWLQTLAGAGEPHPRLWVVTTGAQPVADAPVTDPLASALWGLGRAAALEASESWGGLIDLDPGASPAEAAAFLLDELLDPDGDQVALRTGQRFVPRLARLRPARTQGLRPRADGSYLVTGGLGGLGLLVARWLVERGARRLVLMARTQLPPRTEWATVGDERLEKVIAAIRGLEQSGASVHLVSADVADVDQLSAWREKYRSEGWPEIRGVVHAAGVMQHRGLLDQDARGLDEVLRAKVDGARELARVLEDAPLEFFVLFSSASAVLSSPNLAGYAAANAGLDGLAHAWREAGRPALSVNWGMWSEAGMVTQFDADDVETLALRGMGAMTNAQGLEALRLLLGSEVTQAAVLPVDWEQWRVRYPALAGAPFLEEVVGYAAESAQEDAGGEDIRATILSAPPEERAHRLRDVVAAQIVRVMQLAEDDIDTEQPLRDLGLDSLMAVEIRNRLEAVLGVSLPLASILEGPSVVQLVPLVSERLGEAPAPGDEVGTSDHVNSRRAAELLDALPDLESDQVDSLLAEMLEDDPAEQGGR